MRFGVVSAITYVVWVSWVLCHVLSWLVSSCVMLFICVMTFCRISFISTVAFSLSLKYILYGVCAVVVLNPGPFLAPPAERQRSFSNADSSVVRRCRQLFT